MAKNSKIERVDLASLLPSLDLNHVVFDKAAIRRCNPHRGHMEHLDVVVYMDTSRHVIAGYKDVRHDEFWAAGHFPNLPVFPGVLQCEAAAQLLCFYATANNVSPGNLLGLGRMEEGSFHSLVRPGDRLVICGQGIRVDRRMTVFRAEGFVNGIKAFQCVLTGAPIGPLEISPPDES